MSSKWRRVEILLPLQLNDGRDTPDQLLAEAIFEVVDRFGAANYETQKLEGHWRQRGVVYRDNVAKIVFDARDLPKNRQWIKKFKRRWKTQLDQLELSVVSYKIEFE